ncbi:MAG: YopX family protein [Firmicutes bacterium]|nr:YopX family protein [Bacillota bacterium]
MNNKQHLYRAKSKKKPKHWVHGNLLVPTELSSGYFIVSKHEELPAIAIAIDYETPWGQLLSAQIPFGTPILCAAVEIDPATIGIYTGHKDKNGKLIFTGDLIKLAAPLLSELLYIVEQDETGEYMLMLDDGSGLLSGVDLGIVTGEYEIKGNIHDNPTMVHKNFGKKCTNCKHSTTAVPQNVQICWCQESRYFARVLDEDTALCHYYEEDNKKGNC